jgi:hypothetical protein
MPAIGADYVHCTTPACDDVRSTPVCTSFTCLVQFQMNPGVSDGVGLAIGLLSGYANGGFIGITLYGISASGGTHVNLTYVYEYPGTVAVPISGTFASNTIFSILYYNRTATSSTPIYVVYAGNTVVTSYTPTVSSSNPPDYSNVYPKFVYIHQPNTGPASSTDDEIFNINFSSGNLPVNNSYCIYAGPTISAETPPPTIAPTTTSATTTTQAFCVAGVAGCPTAPPRLASSPLLTLEINALPLSLLANTSAPAYTTFATSVRQAIAASLTISVTSIIITGFTMDGNPPSASPASSSIHLMTTTSTTGSIQIQFYIVSSTPALVANLQAQVSNSSSILFTQLNNLGLALNTAFSLIVVYPGPAACNWYWPDANCYNSPPSQSTIWAGYLLYSFLLLLLVICIAFVVWRISRSRDGFQAMQATSKL